MGLILLVSVGGSPDPILFAVQMLRQERGTEDVEVVFICSVEPCPKPSIDQVVGDGFPCLHFRADGSREEGANLVKQLGITEFNKNRHLVGIPDPDDLADAFQRIRDHILLLRSDSDQIELRGDYTGGTKSMSAALAMACVQLGISVGVVVGQRTNLQRIDQSETTRLMAIAPLHATHQLETELRSVLKIHNYGEAEQLVCQFDKIYSNEIDETARQCTARLRHALRALHQWDQFQWVEAKEQGTTSDLIYCVDLMDWWQRVVLVDAHMQNWDPSHEVPAGITGYELVQDLILSAERRGKRGWYDDAVARLYRALELLAETYIRLELRLKQSNKINRHKGCYVYYNSNQEVVDGPTTRGVSNLYHWIQKYEQRVNCSNGLGDTYKASQRQIDGLIRARNKSLLAHGLQPLREERWLELQRGITRCVNHILQTQGINQGPPPCQLPASDLLSIPSAQRLFGAVSANQP